MTEKDMSGLVFVLLNRRRFIPPLRCAHSPRLLVVPSLLIDQCPLRRLFTTFPPRLIGKHPPLIDRCPPRHSELYPVLVEHCPPVTDQFPPLIDHHIVLLVHYLQLSNDRNPRQIISILTDH
jgi:hypothetical protein